MENSSPTNQLSKLSLKHMVTRRRGTAAGALLWRTSGFNMRVYAELLTYPSQPPSSQASNKHLITGLWHRGFENSLAGDRLTTGLDPANPREGQAKNMLFTSERRGAGNMVGACEKEEAGLHISDVGRAPAKGTVPYSCLGTARVHDTSPTGGSQSNKPECSHLAHLIPRIPTLSLTHAQSPSVKPEQLSACMPACNSSSSNRQTGEARVSSSAPCTCGSNSPSWPRVSRTQPLAQPQVP
ncbi:unnamed protein product [Leuciscus chuanchicus]